MFFAGVFCLVGSWGILFVTHGGAFVGLHIGSPCVSRTSLQKRVFWNPKTTTSHHHICFFSGHDRPTLLAEKEQQSTEDFPQASSPSPSKIGRPHPGLEMRNLFLKVPVRSTMRLKLFGCRFLTLKNSFAEERSPRASCQLSNRLQTFLDLQRRIWVTWVHPPGYAQRRIPLIETPNVPWPASVETTELFLSTPAKQPI